jgi:glycosyl transferase family 2
MGGGAEATRLGYSERVDAMRNGHEVSVLIPVRNGARFLGEALESVSAQTYDDFEIILVDDASTDEIREVLERYPDPRLRVLRRGEPGGTAIALNDGLAEARGRYVAVMHADDIALAHRLALEVEFLNHHPDVGIVGGNQQPIDVDGRSIGSATHLPTSPGHIRWMLHVHNCLNHPTIMARRHVLVDLGGYRPDAVPAEDYFLWIDALETTRIANIDDVVLRYRIHPESASSTRSQEMDSLALDASEEALVRRLHAPPDRSALRILRDPALAEAASIAEVRGAASLLWRFTDAVVGGGGLEPDERRAIERSAIGWFSHLTKASARRSLGAAARLAVSPATRPPGSILRRIPEILGERHGRRSVKP